MIERRIAVVPLLAVLLITGLCAGCSGTSTARPAVSTSLVPTTTVPATGPVSTTIPIATTTTPPLDVVDLSSCPRDHPKTSTATSTSRDLVHRMVPIDALNIRICEYAGSGSSTRVTRLSWLALSVARAFEDETNRLTSPSAEPPARCAGPPQGRTSFLLTFAIDTKTVDVVVGDCPVTASNGRLTLPVSARWYADLERYTNGRERTSAHP